MNINSKLLQRCSLHYPYRVFFLPVYLSPDSILWQYLLEFENHNIQFPAFSWNMQTIQQEQNKYSLMTIKEYP